MSDSDLSKVIVFIAFILVATAMGWVAGAGYMLSSVQEDCNDFGAVKLKGTKYQCAKVGDTND